MSPSSGAAVVRDGWRRFLPTRRQILWGVLGAFLLLVIVVGIAYAFTTIPSPNSFATQQTTYLYYSDGHTVLARLGATNRTDVRLDQVPLDVQHAVLAAEDRNFETEPGISPTGILRALWVDLRGGDIQQGGSTITQQYVKNAYLSQQRTFTRKIKEILIAVKLGQSRSKDQILQDYLNTIYFGRGAYGIEAAARAYFHANVTKLTAAQGAVLAALIQAPSAYDPVIDPSAAKARWQYVVNGMVDRHWLSSAEAANLRYPKVYPPSTSTSGCVGPTGFICQAVSAELDRLGFDSERLAAGGYRVITTIDKQAQRAAVKAESDVIGKHQNGSPESALVSVQPGDGAIRAMYGGSEFCEHKHRDDCTDLTGVYGNYGRPPGSSFKPYTLIAALKQGISLDSTYDGPPHISFPGTNGQGISNAGGESCMHCTLLQALAKSINTIFVPLAQDVGPDHVVAAAHDAGIPKSVQLPAVPAITLGTDPVSPLDQAVAYATIAAQGVRAEPYLVAAVRTTSGHAVYRAKPKTERVFGSAVMADTTYAMTKVLDCSSGGTACGKALPGRPAAGKTGTVGTKLGNLDAWFIGFTPQLSTAVWLGNANPRKPVTSNGSEVFGGDKPAQTWQEMMTLALTGRPVLQFPPPAHVGTTITSASPTPTPTTSSPSPSTQSPSPTPSPTSPSPTPSVSTTVTTSPSTKKPKGGGGTASPSPT